MISFCVRRLWTFYALSSPNIYCVPVATIINTEHGYFFTLLDINSLSVSWELSNKDFLQLLFFNFKHTFFLSQITSPTSMSQKTKQPAIHFALANLYLLVILKDFGTWNTFLGRLHVQYNRVVQRGHKKKSAIFKQQAQNLCIDASVDQIWKKVKSFRSLKTF